MLLTQAAAEKIQQKIKTTWSDETALGYIIEIVADAVGEAVKERETGILRAYHVTLDSFNAPPDEWPCNRVKLLVDAFKAQVLALREALDKYAKGYMDGGIMAREALAEALSAPPAPEGEKK